MADKIYSFDRRGLPRGTSGRFFSGIAYNVNNKPNTGRHLPEEVKQKMSESAMGKPATPGSFKKGHIVPQYVRDKISKSGNRGRTYINRLIYERIYGIWTRPILERDNFICQQCGNISNLQVHHSKETMAEIVDKFMSKKIDLSINEKKAVVEKVIQYHLDNGVEGITLCKKCHRNTPTYGARNKKTW